MNMTNFEKVKQFSKTFGVPMYKEPQINITKTNQELVKLRKDLIVEECKELVEAIENHDFTEIVDALSDILYVVYGAGASFGVNLDKAFDIVHKSNMSKVCKTEAEAIATVAWYKKNEIHIYDSPEYKLSDDKKYWIVFNKSTGKILKSINYKKVAFKMDTLGL